jgi:hypothetical protein
MKITTTHEIKPNHMDPTRGTLTVQLYVNGQPSQTVQLMSGPIQDIRQFVAGEINEAEVNRRWGITS